MQQGDPLKEFDRLTAKKKPAANDPLAAFDLLVGDATKPSGGGGAITPAQTGDRQPAPKPEAGRGPSIFTRDLAPVVRSSAKRAKHAIGAKLDELLTGGAYQRNVIPRIQGSTAATPLAHPLTPVTVEADPQRVVRRLARLDPITQVLANTQTGIDKAPAGGEAPYTEESFQENKRRLLEKYNTTADDFKKKRLSRMLGQLEKQRSEAVALRKEDPISAAGRAATFGALQTPERMAIRREHERDIAEGRAVTPEEIGAEGIIHEGERPHRVEPGETGAQAVAGLAGSILPFEVGERAGMHVAAKIADAIEVGVPRARSIAQALRFAESPVTATTEFGRGAQMIAKGAIRGQAGGAFIGATEAAIHDQPVGETVKAGIVPYAELGSLFGAAGAGFKIPNSAIDVQTGAYIADATHMIEATRPDQTPIGDKMPEAHGRAIADMINRLIGAKKSAMTPDERLQLAAQQKRPQEGIITPESYTGSREARAEARDNPPLRTAQQIAMEQQGIEPRRPTDRVPQTTSEALWEQGSEARAARLNSPAGQDEAARRLLRGQRWTPEGFVPENRPEYIDAQRAIDAEEPPPQPLHEQFDMSKNLERVQEEQRVQEEERANAEATQRLEAAKAAAAPPKTFIEQLRDIGSGDAVQRMKDSDLVAYARRVARHTDKVGKELQQRVWQEIKGRGLDKKVGPAALALAAVAGATQTEDEGKRAALLGAAALTTGRMHEGEYLYSRLEKFIESRPWKGAIPATEAMNKFKTGPFSQAEFDQVLRPMLEHEAKQGGKVTHFDVLRTVREKGIDIGDVRATPMGADIKPGEEARLDEPTPVRRTERAELADEDNDPQGPFSPDYTPETPQVRQEYEEAIEQARADVDRANAEVERARGGVEDAYRELGLSPIRTLHNALARAEEDGAVDTSKALDYLRENSVLDDIYYPELNRSFLPEGWDIDELDPAGDEGRTWVVKQGDNVVSSWPTELQAWGDMNGRSGAEIPRLGNLTEILDDMNVRKSPTHPGSWEIVQYSYNGADEIIPGQTRVLSRDIDIDDLVRQYVHEEFQPEQGILDDLESAIGSYGEAFSRAYDVESETYNLREGEIADHDDWMDRLREARENDEAAAAEYRNQFENLRDYDPAFYELTEDDQEYIRRGQELGAVGTMGPLGSGDDLATRPYVFDPEIPHTPFPREGVRRAPDPAQFELLPEPEQAATALAIEAQAPPQETSPLKATARSKFNTYQRVPGGKNYREIRLTWENAPGEEFTEGHWDEPNVIGHLRMTEHDYFPPTEEMKRRLEKIIEHRSRLGAEQGEVARRYNELQNAAARDAEGARAPSPEEHALAREYAEINERVQAVETEYNDAKAAINMRETGRAMTPSEKTLNAFEHQSDWKQQGESKGYKKSMPEEELAALRREDIDLGGRAISIGNERNDTVGAVNAKYRPQITEARRLRDAKRQEYIDYIDREPGMAGATAQREYIEADTAVFKLQEEVATAIWNATAALDEEYAKIVDRRQEIEKVLNRFGVPDMPLKDPDQIFGLTSARMLAEAARGDYERVAWSTAENRKALAHLSMDAGKITYDQSVTGAVKRLLKGLGIKAEIEKIVMDGYDHWSVKLTPEMRQKMREVGFPLLGVLALAGATTTDDDKKGAAGVLAAGAFLTRGKVWKLVREGGMHGEIDPNAVTERILAPAVAAKTGEFATGFMHHDAAWNLNNALGLTKEQDLKAYDKYLHGFVTNRGRVLSKKEAYKFVEPELKAPIKSQIANRTRAGADPTLTSEDMRGKLYSNPIIPALKELKKYPTAASVAAVAGLASSSDDKDISDTAPPLYALAILSAIGSKNLAGARDALGKVLVDNLRKTDAGTSVVRFINPDALLSPDVRAAVLAFEALRHKGTARQIEYTSKLKRLGPVGDRLVSDFIEGEQFEDPKMVRAMKPEDIHAIAVVAQDAADEVQRGTAMQIASGALDPQYAIEHYLPGKYAYWEALDALTERAPRGKGATQKPRISPTKRRTLERTDIAERNRLGEIRESSYRVGLAIEKAYANTAAATLFKTLRSTPGVIHPEFLSALDDFLVAKDLMRQAKAANNAADIATAEAMLDAADLKQRRISAKFKLRGGDYVTLPDTKSMGVLKGMVVDRDVANSLNGLPEKRQTDKLLRFWKLSKTVFNPGTHAANVISNTTMAHMGGMRMTEQPYWLTRAASDMKKYGEATRALSEAGVLDVNAVTAGGEGATARSVRSERGLGELAETTRPETAKVLRDVGITAPKESKIPTFKKAAQDLRELYNNEDNIFRVAMYLKARAPKELKLTLAEGGGFGLSPDEAVTYARDSFGNFRTRSPLLRVIRGSVAPFILYPAKALPAFAKNVVDHPVRYLTLISMWGALNEYSKQEVGEIPEEDIDERDRRAWGYFFPGLTQLPFTSKTGAHAATDLSRWTPMSGATDVAVPGSPAAAISPNVPRILQPSGPLADIYGKFVNNIDPFTHQPRYKADYPVKRNIGRALEDVIQLVAPSALGFHRERIMQDIDNRDMEALKTDLLGPTGLRPRYLRAGGNVMNAEIERQRSMQDAKAEARRALSHSQSPDRDEEIMKDYLEYVDQIEKNFQRRAAIKPAEEK